MLDLSTSSIGGSHTKALGGGEEVDFQIRKMCKTTNSLYLTDNQGLALAISSPISGNHHYLYQIKERLDELFITFISVHISTVGLFVNAHFDSKKFRDKCSEFEVISNTALNLRMENEKILFGNELYEQRYIIERTNVWMDSYRTLLNRFETKVSNWKSFNYITFMIILFKKSNKKRKV